MHAIAFIGTRRVELEDFVDHYYSVEMFKAAYATTMPPMPGKEEWEKVEIGFKLLPPKCNRAAGSLRKMVGVEEGGSTSKGKRRCKRCGGLVDLATSRKPTMKLS